MFSISGDTATSGPVLVSSSSLFGRVKSICPSFPEARVSIHLRTSQLRDLSTGRTTTGPKARLILVLLYSLPVLTGDPDPCDETLSLY